MINKLKYKYEDFVKDSNIYELEMTEVFTPTASYIQKCGDIIFTRGIPFSKIIFPKGSTIEALFYVLLKTTGGYNNPNNFEIKINNIKIEDIKIWCYDENSTDDDENDEKELIKFIDFIENVKIYIKENNEILIFHKNLKNIGYFEYTIIYRKFLDGTDNLDEMLEEWEKNL